MKFHFWYSVLSILFAALVVTGYQWLEAGGRSIVSIPPGDFLLIALATMRLVRLFTYDIITSFVRNWFAGASPESFLGTLGALVNCPWCSGLWFAALLTFLYFATPVAWYFILILAVSSVATFFQLLANYTGWAAEAKKREAQG
jgi:hypothetical protein